MAGITTHVLNTATGAPGAGMRIDFSVWDKDRYRLMKTVYTNQDGRTDQMILKPEETRIGRYELVFHVREYFASMKTPMPELAFIDSVPVRFLVFDTKQHYHVPMLATPWSCTTYRGS